MRLNPRDPGSSKVEKAQAKLDAGMGTERCKRNDAKQWHELKLWKGSTIYPSFEHFLVLSTGALKLLGA